MNLRPYEVFNDLKTKYTAVKVEIASTDIQIHASTFKTPEEYIKFLFKRKNIDVKRYRHDYDSLNTPTPKLGLIFLASEDSPELNPTIEVWGLMGYNLTDIERIQSDVRKGH